MNKDQIKGPIKVIQGAVKEVVGNIVGNKSLEAEGLAEKTVGKVQAGLGDIKSDLKSKL